MKTKEQRQAISGELMMIQGIAYRLNSTCTEKETTGEKPTVFTEFIGHVCGFRINIFNNGWVRGESPDYQKIVYLDGFSSENAEKELEEIHRKLSDLLSKWEGEDE